MSYRCSRARRAFELQIENAIQELTPLYNFARKNGGHGAPRLLAAYYVFAFAQFEVFIKSFVEDLLNTVTVSNPALEKWPDLMLAYLLHRGDNLGADYRRFGIGEDEGTLLAKVAQTARKVVSWSEDGALPAELIAADFLEKKKYPSPKNLPQLFKRLGIKQIWPIVSAAGRMNSELILTSLNDLRTDIAHEGKLPPGFSFVDFRNRLDQMGRFVAALDRGVSAHFCADVVPRSSWNQLMA